MPRSLSLSRTAKLILRLRFAQLRASLSAYVGRRFGTAGTPVSGAGKDAQGLALLLIGLLALWMATRVSSDLIDNVLRAYGQRELHPIWPPPVLSYLAVELGVVLVATLMLTLSARDLSAPAWDLEWLAMLPIRMRTLLAVQLVEKTVSNLMGIIGIVPFLSVIAWRNGWGLAAPAAGVITAAPLLAAAGALQSVADTGLRLRVGPERLRNLQAAFAIIGACTLCVALFSGLSTQLPLGPLLLPGWITWTPPGLAVAALTRSGVGLSAFGLLALECGALVILTQAWLERELRMGIVSGGLRETGRRGHGREPARSALTGALWESLSPVYRRELRLLARDRKFLVQAVVTPIVVVVIQWSLSFGRIWSLGTINLSHVAALGLGLASYSLMYSAFQSLGTEGAGLWLLYTLPQDLRRVVRQKVVLWATFALLCDLILFGFAVVRRRNASGREFVALGYALVGVPILSIISASLGVLATNVFRKDSRARINTLQGNLFLLLATLYVCGIYVSAWSKVVLLTLTSLVALALWQLIRDHLPYVLDPTASPQRRVSLVDGLVAAMAFFVLQGLALLYFLRHGEKIGGGELAMAFLIAGLLASIGLAVVYSITRPSGVPRLLGDGNMRAALVGSAAGAGAAAFAGIYLMLLRHFSGRGDVSVQPQTTDAGLWNVALTVVAILGAPVFEEIIFRGLVFGGIRRSFSFRSSTLVSAAIFAVIHPPLAVAPVFVLGIGTALVYERTAILLAPIFTHAIYNLGVFWLQHHMR
jgi:ABC-2 type transport system permease protein